LIVPYGESIRSGHGVVAGYAVVGSAAGGTSSANSNDCGTTITSGDEMIAATAMATALFRAASAACLRQLADILRSVSFPKREKPQLNDRRID
jgi:hypothetical protein